MTGRRITDANALMAERVWVLLTYPDGSEFCFQTTLNPALLHQEGVVLDEGKLVRLDKKYLVNGQMVYRQFPYEGAVISMWTSETYNDPMSAKLRAFF